MLTIAAEDNDTINLLNTHAEAVVSMVRLLDAYHLAFQAFLKAIEIENYPQDFNNDPTSSCSRAYWAYFDIHAKLPKKGGHFFSFGIFLLSRCLMFIGRRIYRS